MGLIFGDIVELGNIVIKKSWLVLVIGVLALSGCAQQKKSYFVDKGQFVTKEGVVPVGCIGSLMTKLNGDNAVASVFLSRNSFRGCIDANEPYFNGDQELIRYDIIDNLGNDTYNLRVCESIPQGSLGSSCDKITVQFINRKYTTPEQTMEVLSLEKLGEW